MFTRKLFAVFGLALLPAATGCAVAADDAELDSAESAQRTTPYDPESWRTSPGTVEYTSNGSFAKRGELTVGVRSTGAVSKPPNDTGLANADVYTIHLDKLPDLSAYDIRVEPVATNTDLPAASSIEPLVFIYGPYGSAEFERYRPGQDPGQYPTFSARGQRVAGGDSNPGIHSSMAPIFSGRYVVMVRHAKRSTGAHPRGYSIVITPSMRMGCGPQTGGCASDVTGASTSDSTGGG